MVVILIEACLIKNSSRVLVPATEFDRELLAEFNTNEPVRVKITKLNPRYLKFHRLYFSGLIPLALDYWQPKGGLISLSEKKTLKAFARWLDNASGQTGAIDNACREFLIFLRDSRSKKIQLPEKVSKESMHEWIKLQAGYFDIVLTPTGIVKKTKSINFNKMNQTEFDRFYKDAFNVVWNLILSREFETEQDAQSAIDKLLGM